MRLRADIKRKSGPEAIHPSVGVPRFSAAFTLAEMLVVIAIIGILMVIGLPSLRGLTKSNALIASNRQFVDDLSYARQRAIADHTSVFVVFVPTNVAALLTPTQLSQMQSADPKLFAQWTNLFTTPFTTYALLSLRQLGEQPGHATPRYLTGWHNLPNGVFIAQSKFATGPQFGGFPMAGGFPYPVASNYFPPVLLPYLAFNYQGQLAVLNTLNVNTGQLVPDVDEYIPFSRGSIFFDPATAAPDLQEIPPGNSTGSTSNVVYINALTGRAKILQQQLQ